MRSVAEAAVYVASFREVNASRDESPDLSDRANLKINLLNKIGSGYQLITPWLAVLSLIFFAVSTFHSFRNRLVSNCYLIAATILIAILARLFIISLIDVSSCPAIKLDYMSPVYPLLLIFITLSLMDCKRL
jgi:hypothetical protein